MKRIGLLIALGALIVTVCGSFIPQPAHAEWCYECFYELCIPVPLGYGFDRCNEDELCYWKWVAGPDGNGGWVWHCHANCQVRNRCFEITEPG